jgi:hypothetical protein
MRARIPSFYLPFVILSLLLSAPQGLAEFKCSSEISYTWVKRQPAPTVPPPGAAAQQVQAQAPAATTPPREPTIVRLLGLERGGADEASAKASLHMETDRQRIRASESCKRDHESFGTCVALKMSSQSTVLNSLSFSARSELEKALTEECRQQEGTCLGVAVSEPKCREIVAAQGATSSTPEKPADGKGAKEPAKGGKKK